MNDDKPYSFLETIQIYAFKIGIYNQLNISAYISSIRDQGEYLTFVQSHSYFNN